MISDILQYIQDNFTQNLVAKDIAKKFGLCPSCFSRLFNKEVGEKFDIYVQNLRLNLAKTLINKGETIKEACFTSGFQSESQFQRVFKARLKMTPTEYKLARIYSREEIKSELDYLFREYTWGLTSGTLSWAVSFKEWLEINNHYSMIDYNKFRKLS